MMNTGSKEKEKEAERNQEESRGVPYAKLQYNIYMETGKSEDNIQNTKFVFLWQFIMNCPIRYQKYKIYVL